MQDIIEFPCSPINSNVHWDREEISSFWPLLRLTQLSWESGSFQCRYMYLGILISDLIVPCSVIQFVMVAKLFLFQHVFGNVGWPGPSRDILPLSFGIPYFNGYLFYYAVVLAMKCTQFNFSHVVFYIY